MYKTRFNRWGLQKTLRFKQVGELLRQTTDRTPVGQDSIRILNGKQVDDMKLKRYIRNLPADKHNQLAEYVYGKGTSPTQSSPSPPAVSSVSCRVSSPNPSISYLFTLPSPEYLRIPEECMSTMRTYISGAVSSGLWSLNPGDILRAGPHFGFYNLARTATKLLKAGQTKQAFQILQNCFHEYKALLLEQSPLLFLYTYVVGLTFANGHPELYGLFMRYVTNLAQIVHPGVHPLHNLFGNMLRMEPEALKYNVVSLFRAYIHLCQLTPDSIAMLDVEGFISMYFGELKLHGLDVTEKTLRSMIVRLEPHRHVDVMEAIRVDARDDLAATLTKQAKYDEAAAIIKESLESRILPEYPLLQASAYRNLFIIAKNTGDREEALRTGHRMVKFASDHWPLSNNKTMIPLTDFVDYLRTINMDETADSIDKDFDDAMDNLSRDIGVMDLDATDIEAATVNYTPPAATG